MNKSEAVAAVVRLAAACPILFTTGYCCRIARGIDDRPNHFYMTGSMGLVSSLGVGVAAATGATTVVVDGDGSLLMNPVGLLAAGADEDLRLVHIVLDDGSYASTGGQATPSRRADLPGLARACGYREVYDTSTASEFVGLVAAAVRDCHAPIFIRCALTTPDAPVGGRIDAELSAHARRFQRYLTAATA